MLRWLKRFAVVMALATGLAAAVCTAVLGPYVRDDLTLDHTVRAVALDWRDFGEEQARQRLLYELDHRRIGTWVADEDCALEAGDAVADAEPPERVVRCDWTADIAVPGADLVIPLRFRSSATVAPSGDIL